MKLGLGPCYSICRYISRIHRWVTSTITFSRLFERVSFYSCQRSSRRSDQKSSHTQKSRNYLRRFILGVLSTEGSWFTVQHTVSFTIRLRELNTKNGIFWGLLNKCINADHPMELNWDQLHSARILRKHFRCGQLQLEVVDHYNFYCVKLNTTVVLEHSKMMAR